MTKKSGQSKAVADKLMKSIWRKTRQTYSAEEKIRIVLAGLRGEESISAIHKAGSTSGGPKRLPRTIRKVFGD